MGTTLWVSRNHAAQTSTIFKTPLPSADANFPVINLRDPDRYVVTVCPAGGFDIDYFLDIGTGRTTNAVGLLGLTQQGTGAAFPNLWRLRRGSVYPEDGTWVDVTSGSGISISPGTRDTTFVLGAAATSRYWKFTLGQSINGHALGKFLLGQTTDLGISYSSGSRETLIRQRVVNPGLMGQRFKTTTGPDRRHFEMLYRSIPGATKDELVKMAAASPFVLLHPTFGIVEVDLVEDSLAVENVFGDVWNVTLEVEQLP